jgi:hypothetical protein
MSPALTNYFWARIGRVFIFPDHGELAWRAVCGVLFVLGIAIIGDLLPLPRNSPDADFAAACREKAEEVSNKYCESVRTAPRKESITSKRSAQ